MLIINVDIVSSAAYGEWSFLHIFSQFHQAVMQLHILKNGHQIASTSPHYKQLFLSGEGRYEVQI
jgi:hypothetical protein